MRNPLKPILLSLFSEHLCSVLSYILWSSDAPTLSPIISLAPHVQPQTQSGRGTAFEFHSAKESSQSCFSIPSVLTRKRHQFYLSGDSLLCYFPKGRVVNFSSLCQNGSKMLLPSSYSPFDHRRTFLTMVRIDLQE